MITTPGHAVHDRPQSYRSVATGPPPLPLKTHFDDMFDAPEYSSWYAGATLTEEHPHYATQLQMLLDAGPALGPQIAQPPGPPRRPRRRPPGRHRGAPAPGPPRGGGLLRHPLPLWFYVLREDEVLNESRRLGPTGGRIVAEVLVGLLKGDPSSYLREQPAWKPDLPAAEPGHFTMPDLLRFAGVA